MASPGPSGNKLSEMLRAGSQPGSAQQYHDEMQSQQQRMAVMAAAVSAGEKTTPRNGQDSLFESFETFFYY